MTNETAFCPPIVEEHLEVNTTATSLGTVAAVSCKSGYSLSRSVSVLECTSDGYWSRLIPSCIKDSGGGGDSQITLIVICVIATTVTLGVILFAGYMLLQSYRQKKKQKTKEEAFENKMREISMCFEVTSDCVGMPAYLPNNRNSSLKGRVHLSESSTDESAGTSSPTTEVSSEQDSDRVFVY